MSLLPTSSVLFVCCSTPSILGLHTVHLTSFYPEHRVQYERAWSTTYLSGILAAVAIMMRITPTTPSRLRTMACSFVSREHSSCHLPARLHHEQFAEAWCFACNLPLGLRGTVSIILMRCCCIPGCCPSSYDCTALIALIIALLPQGYERAQEPKLAVLQRPEHSLGTLPTLPCVNGLGLFQNMPRAPLSPHLRPAVGAILGKGGFGEVYKGHYASDKVYIAPTCGNNSNMCRSVSSCQFVRLCDDRI